LDATTTSTLPANGSLILTANADTQQTITASSMTTTPNLIGTFISQPGIIASAIIPGMWNLNIYANVLNPTPNTYFYSKVLYSTNGSSYTMVADGSSNVTTIPYLSSGSQIITNTVYVNTFIQTGYYIKIEVYGYQDSGTANTIYLYLRGASLSHLHSIGTKHTDIATSQTITGDKTYTGNVVLSGTVTSVVITQFVS
jgi:hypothetical protein